MPGFQGYLTLGDVSFKPAGYCPSCGYPVSPGVCPECGLLVTARELASEPPHLTRRRRLRVATIVALTAIALYGGFRLYRDVNWLRWLPSSALLWFEHADWQRADREILRRCGAGEFTAAEIDGLFRRAYSAAAIYARRVPSNTPMPVIVRVAPTGPLKLALLGGVPHSLRRDDWTVAVGERTMILPEEWGVHLNYLAPEVQFELPPLPAGEHAVSVDGCLWYSLRAVAGMPPSVTWCVQLPFSVTVEDRPLTHYVSEEWSTDLADAMMLCATAGAYAADGGFRPQLFLQFRSAPVGLAFEVFVSAPGAGDYEAVQHSSGLPWRLMCPSGAQWGCNIPLPQHIIAADSVNVQLRPCPREALLHGLSECFAGTVEWHGLTLTGPGEWHGTLGRGGHVYPPRHMTPPTRIF